MADLDALKQKYTPVITMIERFVPYGATLDAVDLAGEQIHIKGSVPSTVVANRVWDTIKKVDPTYSDLKHEIGTSGGETQPVTIKSGDTLSAINAATAYLPANMPYPPLIRKVNPADTPILVLGVTSDSLPLTVVDAYAQNILLQKISQISGVGLVGVGGQQQPAVRVGGDQPSAIEGNGECLRAFGPLLALREGFKPWCCHTKARTQAGKLQESATVHCLFVHS